MRYKSLKYIYIYTRDIKQYVIFVKTFQQRHCFIDSPYLITNYTSLPDEDNNKNNMFHCRYGQQVDFSSDDADIQQSQHHRTVYSLRY